MGGRSVVPGSIRRFGGQGMAFFLSTYVNKVDKKGRVSVPATFRAALSAEGMAGIVCYRSFTAAAIEGCGMDLMKQMAATVNPLDPFAVEENPNALILGDARELNWDPEGRVILPEDLIAHAGITESAAFYGMGPKFQIWQPDALKTAIEALRERTIRERMAAAGRGGAA